MFNIVGIKTNQGYFITNIESFASNYITNVNSYIINGEVPKVTQVKSWFLVSDVPQTLENKVSQPAINKRYELKNKDFADKFNISYPYDSVTVDGEFTGDFYAISSLYEYKDDKQPDKFEAVPFTFELLATVDEIKSPNFSYQALYNSPSYYNDQKLYISADYVNYPLVSRLLVPQPLLYSQACSLSSVQMYQIVRAYIKENLNPKVAKITSDYAFCFTVKKIINLAETYNYVREDIFAKKGKRRPAKEVVYVSSRDVEVFEMTSSADNYKGYTPISALHGDSLEDLKLKLDEYLKNLIDIINLPLVECSHCKGKGVTTPREENNE